jgi:hypothetical protein
MRPTRRAGWIVAGVLIASLIAVSVDQLRQRSANRIPLTETSVMVAAKPPADTFFPIEFLITNDFQPITNVLVSCIVDRFVTDQLDLVDTERRAREEVPAMAQGAQRQFACPAPPELSLPPLRLGDVRRAHVSVEVLFSVPGRRQPLGVRQPFDLVVDPVRRAVWVAAAPALSR